MWEITWEVWGWEVIWTLEVPLLHPKKGFDDSTEGIFSGRAGLSMHPTTGAI